MAIERFRQDASNRGFTYPPLTCEKKGMGNPIADYGVLQGFDYVLLTNNLFKNLWPPFTC
jgi:hypothetical protein